MPTSAQAEAEKIFPTWYYSQPPVGSVACTASSQISEYLLHDKKCCNSVRAILPTLGSKNAKQESPL